MKLIRNEKGIALVMVLVFSLIGLAIVSGLLFMLTQGTRMSGALKVYKSVEEAGLGGTLAAVEMIKNRGLNPALTTLPFGLDPCLQQKLSATKGTTSPTTWGSCGTAFTDPRFSPDPTAEDPACPLDPVSNKRYCADMIVRLPGIPGITYVTFTKIIDTVKGNTDTSGLVTTGELGGAGVVASSSGQVAPPPIPYLYRVEVQTQNEANPVEKSRYSTLYAY